MGETVAVEALYECLRCHHVEPYPSSDGTCKGFRRLPTDGVMKTGVCGGEVRQVTTASPADAR